MTHQSTRSKLPSPWDDKVILTALAIAQALSLAYASTIIDGFSVIPIIRGLLMGCSVSFGMAVSAQRLGKIGTASKVKRQIMIGVVVALFVVSPAIMFAGFYDMPTHVRAYHVLAVIGCDLAAAAVAIGAKALADETAKQATTSEKPVKQAAKPAEPVAKYRCSCGWASTVSADGKHQQAEWAGHKRQFPLHTRKADGV